MRKFVSSILATWRSISSGVSCSSKPLIFAALSSEVRVISSNQGKSHRKKVQKAGRISKVANIICELTLFGIF